MKAKLQSLQDPGNFVKSTIKVRHSSKKNIFRKMLRNESIREDGTRYDHVWTSNPDQKCRTTTGVSNALTLHKTINFCRGKRKNNVHLLRNRKGHNHTVLGGWDPTLPPQ